MKNMLGFIVGFGIVGLVGWLILMISPTLFALILFGWLVYAIAKPQVDQQKAVTKYLEED